MPLQVEGLYSGGVEGNSEIRCVGHLRPLRSGEVILFSFSLSLLCLRSSICPHLCTSVWGLAPFVGILTPPQIYTRRGYYLGNRSRGPGGGYFWGGILCGTKNDPQRNIFPYFLSFAHFYHFVLGCYCPKFWYPSFLPKYAVFWMKIFLPCFFPL